MFSQHTRLSGKFHEFVTSKNVEKGGHWRVLRLDANYSPIVEKKQLIVWKTTYTEDEYRVRVKGLPPISEDGMLISTNQAYSIYENTEFRKIEHLLDTLIFSYDLGYTGIRDSSVLSVFEGCGIKSMVTERIKPYFDIKDIYVYQGTNGKLPIEFIEEIFKIIIRTIDDYFQHKRYKRIIVVGDSSVAGEEPFRKLEEMFLELGRYDIEFKGLKWGTDRLYFEDKQRFINMRAKCWVNFREALDEKRVRSSTDKYQHTVLHQLTNIPYNFDAKYRYKMASKEDMRKKNINSPDIGDTFAQIFALRFDDGVDMVEIDDTTEYDDIEDALEEFSDSRLIALDNDGNEIEVELMDDTDSTEDDNSNIDILMPSTVSSYSNDEHKKRLDKNMQDLNAIDILEDDF
jgi:hypothetical protein